MRGAVPWEQADAWASRASPSILCLRLLRSCPCRRGYFCLDHSLFDGKLTIWMGTVPIALKHGMRLPPFEAEDFTVESNPRFPIVVAGDQQNRGHSPGAAELAWESTYRSHVFLGQRH